MPLPPSFQDDVEAAVERLPAISRRACSAMPSAAMTSEPGFSYVPDRPVPGRDRRAPHGARRARSRARSSTSKRRSSRPTTAVFPDPYALKKVSPEGFAAAVLPAIPPPEPGQHAERIAWMAAAPARAGEDDIASILFVCSLLDWPWIRDAYLQQGPRSRSRSRSSRRSQTFAVDPRDADLLPRRAAVRDRPVRARPPRADRRRQPLGRRRQGDGPRSPRRLQGDATRASPQRITPQLLSIYFRYVRNLSLIERRLTPDLYTLVVAAKQTAGDDFALALAETAREYPLSADEPDDDGLAAHGHRPGRRPGLGRRADGQPPAGPGASLADLRAAAPTRARASKAVAAALEPVRKCSWPPEDDRIESFTAHVRDQAKAIIGADLARSEKFTTSVMDGLDIRETLRNWHTGDLYVKIIPPSRGSIEVVVFLFDTPGRPATLSVSARPGTPSTRTNRRWPSSPPTRWRTWSAPASPRRSTAGRCSSFRPGPSRTSGPTPRSTSPTRWKSACSPPRCCTADERHVALVSPRPPRPRGAALARRFGRKIVHLPLKRFSGQLIERLRHLPRPQRQAGPLVRGRLHPRHLSVTQPTRRTQRFLRAGCGKTAIVVTKGQTEFSVGPECDQAYPLNCFPLLIRHRGKGGQGPFPRFRWFHRRTPVPGALPSGAEGHLPHGGLSVGDDLLFRFTLPVNLHRPILAGNGTSALGHEGQRARMARHPIGNRGDRAFGIKATEHQALLLVTPFSNERVVDVKCGRRFPVAAGDDACLGPFVGLPERSSHGLQRLPRQPQEPTRAGKDDFLSAGFHRHSRDVLARPLFAELPPVGIDPHPALLVAAGDDDPVVFKGAQNRGERTPVSGTTWWTSGRSSDQ